MALTSLSFKPLCCPVQFDAVYEAQGKGCAVQHPLLDRVRQRSARSDMAADFFTLVFMPHPEHRGTNTLNEHPYLAEVWAKMEAATEAATKGQDESGMQCVQAANMLKRKGKSRVQPRNHVS